MRINPLCSVFTATLLALSINTVVAQAQTAPKAQPNTPTKNQPLSIAVHEGVSGNLDPLTMVNKYRPLAEALGKAIGQQVIVTPTRSFEALVQGMKKDEFDMVVATSADYPARGIRDYGYSLVATAKPDSQCVFLVEKSSSLKKIEDVKGKQIVTPGKLAYMTHFCGAELRDHGIDINREQVKHAKDQAAVGWTVENKLADVGFVASFTNVAKNWEKNGHRILHKTSPQPFFAVIASKRISQDQVAKMQKVLVELGSTEDGKKVLSALGIDGYNIESKERLLNLLKWLEKA